MNELRSTDAKVREQAARRLGRQQDRRAVDALIRCLKDRAYQVQAAAAKALGQIGDERAVEPLINCLKGGTYRLIDADGNPGRYFEIVSSAAWALGRIGTALARQALLEHLDSTNLRVAAAVVGFGQLRDEQAFEVLRDALCHRDHYVRLCAVRALAEWGDSRAADLLLAALEDGVWVVEVAAMEALGDLRDERASDHLLRCYQSVKETSADFLSNSDHSQYMPIQNTRLQVTAARSLALMAHSLSMLENDFTSDPWPMRAIAAVGLAYHRDMRVFETLLQAVHDHKEPTLQVEAAKALVYLSDPSAIPALQAVVANRRIWDEASELLDELDTEVPQPAGWIREQVRPLLCGLIDGTVDVVTGCRRLAQLHHYGFTWISTLFVGLNSELDIVPPPETYHQWNPQALEQKLKEVQPILDAYRTQAQAEAQKMLEEYFPGELCL